MIGGQRVRTSLFALMTAASAVLFLFGSATGARAEGRVSVLITDDAGNPVKDASATLVASLQGWKPDPKGSVARQVSDKKGRVFFGFVKTGDYVLTVTLGEKIPVKVAIKLRDDKKKPVKDADDQVIPDREGAVDPRNPVIPVTMTPQTALAEIAVTLGTPAPQAAAAAAGPSGDVDIKDREIKAAASAAVAAIQAEQFDIALEQIAKLLEKRADMKPGDLASVLYMQGFSLARLSRNQEAEPVLREAIGLDPKLEPAYAMLSRVLIEQKKWDDAAAILRSDLELTEDTAARVPKLLNLGLALREAGKNDEAIPALEGAYALAPTDQSIVVQLADAYMVAGRQDDADKLLAQLTGPEAATLHFNMAALAARAKNWAGAESHFRKALELDPKLVDAHRYLGETLLNLDRRDDALVEFEAYVASAPAGPEVDQVKAVIDAIRKDQKTRQKKGR